MKFHYCAFHVSVYILSSSIQSTLQVFRSSEELTMISHQSRSLKNNYLITSLCPISEMDTEKSIYFTHIQNTYMKKGIKECTRKHRQISAFLSQFYLVYLVCFVYVMHSLFVFKYTFVNISLICTNFPITLNYI